MTERVAEETELVEAATRGDQEAFRRLVEPITRELHLFTYRMLGFAEYLREKLDGPYKSLAFTVATLTRDGRLIAEKVSFVRPELFSNLGFPQSTE